MNKGIAALPLIVIISIGLIVLTGGSFLKPFATFGLEEAVFCNDYEFMCAGLQSTSKLTGQTVDYGKNFQCSADKCMISNVRDNANQLAIFQTAANGSVCSNNFFGALGCTNEVNRGSGSTVELQNGDRLYRGSGWMTYDIENKNAVLKWCGDAACDASVTGIQVIGANKNTFITDKSIYDPSGFLIKQPDAGQISYTIPVGNCALSQKSQFICGTKFDQCQTDADCVSGHTYTVDGKGAEIVSGQLQLYGCKTLGTAPTQDQLTVLPKETIPNFNYGNKCGVVSEKTVQCAPGSSTCGSNAFCDIKTFTCVQQGQAECTSDWQCGTSLTYDQPTKELRKPVCALNKCITQVQQKVECFYNSECAEGWYCDQTFNQYTCKQASDVKQACPYECCEGDARFFDRPAPSGKICCSSGKIAANQAACTGDIVNPPVDCGLFGLGCFFQKLGIVLLIIIGIIIAFVASKFIK